jgi:ABC-type sugar transport system substrate-binding protein
LTLWIGDVPDTRFSKGEKVPESIDTGTNLITKDNMNSERSKKLLTPESGIN